MPATLRADLHNSVYDYVSVMSSVSAVSSCWDVFDIRSNLLVTTRLYVKYYLKLIGIDYILSNHMQVCLLWQKDTSVKNVCEECRKNANLRLDSKTTQARLSTACAPRSPFMPANYPQSVVGEVVLARVPRTH